MKRHRGGLGNFLNEVTQTAEKSNSEQIIYIDIDELETNPRNFYGLRDIDALAGLIAVSHLVEPLTVSQKPDGKYMIISGHRRRAAVQKLLDEGDYTERKLPCIIKPRGKISIEQEDGEIIEFDEDAVEMLNLIASNRGQREERTLDEKLQEVKYLETFAKAIYHQKNRGKRGRFRNFFAEEILNMSKSQLQRISAMENLTDRVRAAVDDKRISESAALAMANMTAQEQESYLEKIESGAVKGTAQAIQKMSASKVAEDDLSPKNAADDLQGDSAAVVSEEVPAGTIIIKLTDVPEEFDDPQKEASDWIYQERMAIYEKIYQEVMRLSEEEVDEWKAAQWRQRALQVRHDMEELKVSAIFREQTL